MRTEAANAARLRQSLNRNAERLRANGWTVTPPPEDQPVDWRNIADGLANRLANHAFCDQHPVAEADVDCPFCQDRLMYWAYRRAAS